MFVILVAMEKEAKYIDCPEAKVIVTGIGAENVLKTVGKAILDGTIQADDTIINVGYAGSSIYNVGDVIAINQVQRLRPSATVNERACKLKTLCISNVDNCITADNFVECARDIIPTLDMELYYLACLLPNIMAFKIVSDNLDYNTYLKCSLEDSWKKINYILNEVANEQN